VLSDLVPGIAALVVAVWAWMIRRSDLSGGWVCAAAIVTLGIGLWHFGSSQIGDPNSREFVGDARKVNRVADYIGEASMRAGLANPAVAVDRVNDCFDGQILRVMVYERQHVWIPFRMMLPTGIMAETEAVALRQLAGSDFVLLADGSDGGLYPFDRSMQAMHPRSEAWCRSHLRVVSTFPVFGRLWTLYARAQIAELAGLPMP